jgi:hypothetical protein
MALGLSHPGSIDVPARRPGRPAHLAAPVADAAADDSKIARPRGLRKIP